jgi:hypothetical protein
VLVVLQGRRGNKSERNRVSKTVSECVQNSAVESVWEVERCCRHLVTRASGQ